jgi:hypothetical protein
MLSVAKMATVIEVYTTEEQRSVVRFLWKKGPTAKGIHKEMFPAYSGKCLPRKVVHNCVEKLSVGSSKVADDDRPCIHVEIATETTVQREKY